MAEQRAILIAGPTASGKSALAIRLAERLGGVVVNADAMAVYRDLAILTGRPSPADLERAPHALFGHRNAAEPYSVGNWLVDVSAVLVEARRHGRVPIVVGGTGLYFKALTQGLSDIPAVPQPIRDLLRAEAAHMAPEELHGRLAILDPATAARLRPTDPQRVLRALEVFEATGRPLSAYQAERGPPLLEAGDFIGVVVQPQRELLRDAIDRRFDRMMSDGALEEARRLATQGLDPALPAMRALGLRPLMAFIDGALTLEEAVLNAKAQTRAYAKRQLTFARSQLRGFAWGDLEALEEQATSSLLPLRERVARSAG